jgi:hypothetical protein
MQSALSPLPDRKGNVLADPSRQAWLEKSYFRWVPHAVSINQKSERVSYSNFLLMALISQRASPLRPSCGWKARSLKAPIKDYEADRPISNAISAKKVPEAFEGLMQELSTCVLSQRACCFRPCGNVVSSNSSMILPRTFCMMDS